MTDRAALIDAGRAYLERWSAWLKEHPGADETVVTAAMQRGDPPPADDASERQASREAEARLEIEQRLSSVISSLSAMRRRFVAGYLVHGNATRAASEAGYKWPGKMGSRLLQADDVRAAIDEYFHAQEMSAREVVARLSQQASAAYAPFLTAAGEVDLQAMKDADMMHLIKSIKPTRYGLAVEFYDAQQALVHVGRFHGLFKDVSTVTLDVSNLSDEELNELADSL